MANACVFCGDDRSRLSDEHVFGDWISEFFTTHFGRPLNGVAELVAADGTVTQYPMVPFQQRVKIVCRSCNHGWMNDLEENARRYLKSMMIGQVTRLRPPAQQHLATWAVKTALVLDHLQPAARVVPDSHYASFYREKRPLGTQVVMASHRTITQAAPGQLLAEALKQPVTTYSPEPDLTPGETEALREQVDSFAHEGCRMYKVTFAVGQFVALVLGHSFPMSFRVTPVGRGKGPATPIWQVSPRFDWSPTQSVDSAGGLRAFHDSFAGQPGRS